MAIYSASLKTISRKAGRSATAAAAYRTGSEVIDERQGLIHDYTRKQGVEHVSRHMPHGLKLDTHDIWNRAEAAEKRKDATVARELVVALPHEMTSVQRTALAEAIAMQLVERYQVAAECSVHLPDKEGDQRNNHAHIQFSTRRMNEDGSYGAKTRELDDIKQGKIEVEWIRQMVEEKTNLALESAGLEVRVDRRSLKDQRAAALEVGDLGLAQELDRAPQVHEGPRVRAIRRECEKAGREPLGALDRAAANDDLNFDLDRGKQELAEVVSMIAFIEKRDAERELARTEAEHEKGLRKDLAEAKTILQDAEKEKRDIGEKYSNGRPHYVTEVRQMRKEKTAAKETAQAWRDQHPKFSKFADLIGIRLETDRAAQYLTAKYDNAPELKNEREWTKAYNTDMSRRKELVGTIEVTQEKVDRLEKEVQALNSPDPEVLQTIKDEVAAGIEHARPQIDSFVDKHRPEIAAAAEIGAGIEAWISTEIISTGNPAIDELSRKGAQFRSRMLREEMQRMEENERIAGQATKKYMAAFRKAFDGAFRSAARDAEPQIDYAAEARRITAEAAAAALKAPKDAPESYVPTWKRGRQHDGFEPGR